MKDKIDFEERYFLFPPVKVQIRFMKYILGVNRGAVNLAVFSELGLFPISIDALKLSIRFWFHLVNADEDSLVSKAYKYNCKLKNCFADKLKLFLEKLGFIHIWDNQNTFSKNRLSFSIVNLLKEHFINYWKKGLYLDENKPNGNKLRTYRELKSDFVLEDFLLLDIQKNILSNFVKLRISNSNLLIEQGRHQNILLDNRLCPMCNLEVEDEFHFVINCEKLKSSRNNLYSKLIDVVPDFRNKSDRDKFNFILSSNDYDIMKVFLK